MELEKQELPYFGLESETGLQLKEIGFLQEQLRNVAESAAFSAFEGSQSALTSELMEDKFYEDKISKAVQTILAQ